VLDMMVGKTMSPSAAAAVVQKTMEEADLDQDGRISFEDFEQVRHERPSQQSLSATQHNVIASAIAEHDSGFVGAVCRSCVIIQPLGSSGGRELTFAGCLVCQFD